MTVADAIAAAAGKTTPVDADEVGLIDSAASWALKSLTWANIKVAVGAWYDAAGRTLTNKTLGSTILAGGSGTATIQAGTGTPEAAVAATVGSLFVDTSGGAATTLYVKESGSSTTDGLLNDSGG